MQDGKAATQASWGFSTTLLRERLRENRRVLAPVRMQDMGTSTASRNAEIRHKTLHMVQMEASRVHQRDLSRSPSPPLRSPATWFDRLSEDEDDLIMESAHRLPMKDQKLRPAGRNRMCETKGVKGKITTGVPRSPLPVAQRVHEKQTEQVGIGSERAQTQLQEQKTSWCQEVDEQISAAEQRLAKARVTTEREPWEGPSCASRCERCERCAREEHLQGPVFIAARIDASCSPRQTYSTDKQTQTRWKAEVEREEARERREESIRELRDREAALHADINKQQEVAEALRRSGTLF
jgi:hypothetical protein